MQLRRTPRLLTRTGGAVITALIALSSCAPADDPPAPAALPVDTPFALPADPAEHVMAAHDCLVSAESQAPLEPDRGTTAGRLDNGLTYYVRRNGIPAGHLELRLVVRAGGVHDPVGTEGTAHFVEHMLFNGTEAFPRNRLIQALRDIGLELGHDENAFTSYDSTVYFMSITTSGTEHLIDKLEVPFEILREWATAATFLPEDVAAERGIVRNELDLRAGSADGRVRQTVEDLMFMGTPYEDARIGGTHDSLDAITPGHLLDFYGRQYVAPNMAVVAVGDVEEDELRDLVDRHFENLPSATRAPDPIPWSEPTALRPQFAHVVHPDIGVPYAAVNWRTPAWRRGTACGERFRIFDQLIHRMLGARLSRAHQSGVLSQANPPALSVVDAAAKVTYSSAEVQGPDLARSAGDFWSVVRGSEAHPFTEAELDRATASLRTALEREVDADTRRHDTGIANDYTEHFVRGADLRSAADRLAYAAHVLRSMTAGELNDYHRWIMGATAAVVVAAGPSEADLPSTSEMESSIANAAAALPPPAEDAATAFMDPPPSTPYIRRIHSRIETYAEPTVVEWIFDNGARVVFNQLDYGGDQVHVMIESLGGTSLLDPADAALAPFALEAVAASGLGDLSAPQVADLVEQSGISLTPYIEHTTEGFVGLVDNSDLEALFAYVHLLLSAPDVGDAAARAAQQNARIAAAGAASSAVEAARAAYNMARSGDSEYFRTAPRADQIDAITADKLLALYRQRFVGVDDLTVAVVGEVSSGEVADLAQSYIGSLASRPSDAGIDRRPPHPSGVTRVEVPADTAAEAGVDYYYELPRSLNPTLVATADVLAAALNEHLLQRVREELGQTYMAQVSIVPLHEPVPRLWAIVSATGPGEALPEIERRVHETLETLATDGPNPSDLAQAISIVTNDAHFGGRLWRPYLLQMIRVVGDENLPTASRIEKAARNVAAADVQALAGALFGSGQRIEIVRSPPPAG